MRKTKTTQHWKKQLVGKWRITSMPDFTKKDVDEEGPAFIEIGSGGSGEFQFLLVYGSAYGDFKNTPDGPVFDFTWEGGCECDEASGDGWIKAKLDGKADGEIRFHGSDTYEFQAVKKPITTKRKSRCAKQADHGKR